MSIELSHEKLPGLELIIERGQQIFVEVACALREIRDRKLFIEAGFTTFEQYVQGRWNWSRQNAYYYIQAAEVVENVKSICQSPPSLTQAITLAPLPAETQRERAAATDFRRVSVRQLKANVQHYKVTVMPTPKPPSPPRQSSRYRSRRERAAANNLQRGLHRLLVEYDSTITRIQIVRKESRVVSVKVSRG